MELRQPMLKITTAEWQERKRRGMATVIQNKPYIVTTHEATHEPVYHPVTIIGNETGRPLP